MKYQMPCVVCKTLSLSRVVTDGIESFQCRTCAGRWFRKTQINRFLRRHAEHGQSVAGLVDAWREAKGQNCPDCRVELREVRFSTALDLTVKTCAGCGGVWTEDEKLAHLIFVDQAKHVLEAETAKPDLLTWIFQFVFLVPLESNIKARNPPTITIAFIALCVIAFLCQQIFPGVEESLALHVPFQGFFATACTLVTYQFLHGDLGHLAGNMYFLYVLGRSVEDVMERKAFILFFLLAGVVSALGFASVSHGQSLLLGASGSISGLLGLYVVVFKRARMTVMLFVMQVKMTVYAYAAFWIGSNFLIAAQSDSDVAWQAHLFGFAAGYVVGKLSYKRIVERRPVLGYVNGPMA